MGILLVAVTGLLGLKPTGAGPLTTSLIAGPSPGDSLLVTTQQWGPSQEVIDAALNTALVHPVVWRALSGTRYRVLAIRAVEPPGSAQVPIPPDRIHATVYDYTNNRALLIEAALDGHGPARVTGSRTQPLPNDEEFNAAVEIARRDDGLGSAIRFGWLRPYRPMPPLVEGIPNEIAPERVLAVGLAPPDGGKDHEIIGVNMVRESVVRFPRKAPQTSLAEPDPCGPAGEDEQTNPGTEGRAVVTIAQGDTVLWRFHVVRPSASSGFNGSGVELRYVDYRGKRVFSRGHVPIVNVLYANNLCGPFRDWLNEEATFQADGESPGPGFRTCAEPPLTIVNTGSDAGNFNGVGIYVAGDTVTLTSELSAGWYRYVNQWKLSADGTIEPRFQFSAVFNSCVCHLHTHHAYWRFDMDVAGPGADLIEELDRPSADELPVARALTEETKSFRDPSRARAWRVRDTAANSGYTIVPGLNDGEHDPWGVADVWVLRYHDDELDDTSAPVQPNPEKGVKLDAFVNGENVSGQNVVMWYAGHVVHDVDSEQHVVGPTLKPFGW